MEKRVYDWEEVIREGKAQIIIPKRELYKRSDNVYEPAWSIVFYNPLMRISRDLTSLTTYTFFNNREFFFIDALSGTGIRGIRLALETSGYGIINDVDPIAYYYMVRNIEFNNVGDHIKPMLCEMNSLLNNYTFSGVIVDYIDIDPYGSPIPFIDSAVKPLAKNGLLGVTATDTAPLVCSHSKKTLRRYNIECIKTDFEKELGLRILIYNIVFRAASQDVALEPLISYSHLYYYRVFFRSRRSGLASYEVLRDCRGYLWYCPSTLERGFVKELSNVSELECLDHRKPMLVGPLWICSLGKHDFLNRLLDNYSYFNGLFDETTHKLLSMLYKEYGVNEPYIRYDRFFGVIKKNMPPIEEFIEFLREHGFKAYRTHFDPRGVKTNASINDLYELFT